MGTVGWIGRLRAAVRFLPCLLLLAGGLVGCGEPVATLEPVFLRAAGSMAMSPLITELAAAFHNQSPLASLDVRALGSQYGLDSLRAGEVDLAFVSWLPAELDPNWHTVPIARDGVAVIVHPTNPVDVLGILQLQDLFGGRIHDWKAVGGGAAQGTVQPVSREHGSGTRAAFESLAMADRPVTPLAVLAPSSDAVMQYVSEHPGAIGYLSMGGAARGVKVLKIEGELPTAETAGRGSYPLTREFWLVTDGPPSGAVRDFVDFVRGPAGQQVVGQRYGRIK
jgi:phosphate transport system substrate-binding protein